MRPAFRRLLCFGALGLLALSLLAVFVPPTLTLPRNGGRGFEEFNQNNGKGFEGLNQNGGRGFYHPSGSSSESLSPGQTACRRIVSLSPGITETLYALNLGERVAGVTHFCRYPPQARQKPSVGGYTDPNLEAVLRLRPDLVVLPENRHDLSRRLANWGIAVLPVQDRSMEGVLDSFRQISAVCGQERQAARLSEGLKSDMDRLERRSGGFSFQPSVLIVVDRDNRTGPVHWVYAAGEDGFYSRMIRLSGGKNALPEGWRGFPKLSLEGILRLNPDVIVELLPGGNIPPTQAMAGWRRLSGLSAVRTGRVYLYTQDYMAIPGPRMLKIPEQLARTLHPEPQHD